MSDMVREDFLKFAASCSGIDGGDINAEYWFVGMEWANVDDIKKYYQNGRWQEATTPESEDEEIKIDNECWVFERRLLNLYQKVVCPQNGVKFLDKNSNSFKLNLLPLPFKSNDPRKDGIWDENEPYRIQTGFTSFEEYKNSKDLMKARQACFAKLLCKGKQPKTIFCFGTGYKELFAEVFGLDWAKFELKGKTGRNYDIYAVYHPAQQIKQILICPFPYNYTYEEIDVQKITDCMIK